MTVEWSQYAVQMLFAVVSPDFGLDQLGRPSAYAVSVFEDAWRINENVCTVYFHGHSVGKVKPWGTIL